MRIFGHKPSEIRKAIAAVCSATLILLVALPIVGLPAGVTAAVAVVTGFLTGVGVYLSKPNVAAVIDGLDVVDLPVDVPGIERSGGDVSAGRHSAPESV